VPGQGFFVVIVGGSHEISSMPAVGIKRGSKDHSKGDGPFVRRGARMKSGPDSSLFQLLPRTQTGRSQLSWTRQVRRDLRGTGEGVSIDLF